MSSELKGIEEINQVVRRNGWDTASQRGKNGGKRGKSQATEDKGELADTRI